MAYKFGTKSLSRLEGVHPEIVEVAKKAIEISRIDFGISCGVRTKREQAKLVASGASQTMNSKHLPQEVDGLSHAIDIFCYVDGRLSWELPCYWTAGDAILKASRDLGTKLRWGACWHIDNLLHTNEHERTCESLCNEYTDLRRSQGRTAFIDAPHWELGK
jgi:peptidoglycan L-alanyl-D-glutamate endopeptidase CwlK